MEKRCLKKISVIVPVYNSEKYLKRCIESIEMQTYSNIEIILINDGSTDRSLNVCKELSKRYKNIIYKSQSNSGPSVARNTGISLANGEYITFVDSDDTIKANMYEDLVKKLEDECADIISCNYDIIFENGRVVYGNNNGDCEIFDTKEKIKKAFFYNRISGISVWNKIFKREIVKDIEFNVNLKHYEDKVFLYQTILNSKKIIRYDISRYCYTKNETSLSSKKFDISYMDILDAQNIIKDISGNDLISQMDEMITKLNLIKMMNVSAQYKIYKDVYREMCKDIKNTSINVIKLANTKEKIKIYIFKLNIMIYRKMNIFIYKKNNEKLKYKGCVKK